MENIRNYIVLTTPYLIMYDVKLEDVAKNWNIDWCTFEEFKLYVYKTWKINKVNFKHEHGMNFQRFFNMQMVLLIETPTYFKFLIKKMFK